MLGKIIVHSLLQDGPGFPFLAPYVYHYITSESIEESFEKVTLSVLPTPVANLIYKVSSNPTLARCQTNIVWLHVLLIAVANCPAECATI